MIDPRYRAQVDLLLRILPHVAEEEVFALKGGTAINLFIREMPRLSVDIDLTYLPLDDRETGLENIAAGLRRIKERLEKVAPEVNAQILEQTDGTEAKLLCSSSRPSVAEVIIEVNTTLRGHLWPVRMMSVADAVQDEFGKFAAIKVVSHQELFGGKICAALDRQHPRDLFDVYHLFKNEGFSDDIKTGFIATLLGGGRPINELIYPNFLDQRAVFQHKFAGMTADPFTYEQFEATREELIAKIHSALNDDDKRFLISFKKGEPNWGLFPVPGLKDMPAIRWKLQNIQKLIRQNPDKHKDLLKALEEKLNGRTS